MGYFCLRIMKNFQVSQFANFFLVGIDHTRADIDIREKFSLSEDKICHLIYDYKQLGGDGLFVMSTCNRTEIYGFGNCPRDIISLFCEHTGNDHDLFYRFQNIRQNREAIEHLFRVGSGLESRILGDFEIIGQLKKSFSLAKGQDSHNAFLDRLVNTAVQTSKRIKNETQLSNGAASVAFAAVQEIKNYMGENSNPNVLLVGTGKIGRTACENLVNQTNIQNITLTNRTDEKAQRLAKRFGIQFIDFDELESGLDQADVIIIATGAPEATVLQSHFKTSKKRLILDLSVPRNAEVSLYDHPDFEVIDVDHLSGVTWESLQRRKDEIPAAEAIIQEMTDDFYVWLESRKVAPTLQALREKMDAWKSREVTSLLKKFPDLNAEHADVLASQILDRITGQFARQLRNGTDINGNLRTIHHIFELEN